MRRESTDQPLRLTGFAMRKKAQLWAGRLAYNRSVLDGQPPPVIRRLTRVTETQPSAGQPQRTYWRLEWLAVADSLAPPPTPRKARPPRAPRKRIPNR